jgi:hypothetical protein
MKVGVFSFNHEIIPSGQSIETLKCKQKSVNSLVAKHMRGETLNRGFKIGLAGNLEKEKTHRSCLSSFIILAIMRVTQGRAKGKKPRNRN